MTVQVPCAKCGDLAVRTALRSAVYCPGCKPARVSNPDRVRDPEHGSYRWRKLSKRARALQPYCLDCGSDYDLSADHLPGSWLKVALRIPLTLDDVEVVCGDCNNYRTSSKLGTPRFMRWLYSDAFTPFVQTNQRWITELLALVVEVDPSFVPSPIIARKLGGSPGGVRTSKWGCRAPGGLGERDSELIHAQNTSSEALSADLRASEGQPLTFPHRGGATA